MSFCPDESALKVRMNNARGPGNEGTLPVCPCLYLIRPNCEKGDQAKGLVAKHSQSVQGRLVEPKLFKERLSLRGILKGFRKLQEFRKSETDS